MKVKVFDESHEKDLENSINSFLNSGEFDIIDKFTNTIYDRTPAEYSYQHCFCDG